MLTETASSLDCAKVRWETFQSESAVLRCNCHAPTQFDGTNHAGESGYGFKMNYFYDKPHIKIMLLNGQATQAVCMVVGGQVERAPTGMRRPATPGNGAPTLSPDSRDRIRCRCYTA